MIKKSITYTNLFTDQEVTEDHYFHISKADLIAMEMEEHKTTYTDKEGNALTGMRAKLQRISDAEDGKAIIEEITDFLRRSYGKREGDRHLKSQAIWEEFSSTEAFSQLLFELCTDATEGAKFIQGIIPHNMDQIIAEVAEKARANDALTGAIAEMEPASAASGDPTGLTVATPDTPREPGTTAWATTRKQAILAATPENPVELSSDDLTLVEHQNLKAGLADGRYKLS